MVQGKMAIASVLVLLFLTVGQGCSPQEGTGGSGVDERSGSTTNDSRNGDAKKEKSRTDDKKSQEAKEISMENNAFRNLRLQGEKGHYTLMGEARVLEGNFRYAVSDGHDYLVEGSVQVQGGAPEWAAFTLKLSIPDEKLPRKGTLTLELFEISPKDGSRQNELIIPLDTFQ